MQELFVPYELAVKLKELGFDEKCFGYYNKNKVLRHLGQVTPLGKDMEEMSNDVLGSIYCSAPTWDQVFSWFRKRHELHGFIDNTDIYKKLSYHAHINRTPEGKRESNVLFLDSYEEARLACLEKLIEICTKNI